MLVPTTGSILIVGQVIAGIMAQRLEHIDKCWSFGSSWYHTSQKADFTSWRLNILHVEARETKLQKNMSLGNVESMLSNYLEERHEVAYLGLNPSW